MKSIRQIMISGHRQSGQAATEFIIAAVFVLVPLFLIIPLLGKYIDIKHAAIQHARYEAWEYTVWSGPKEHIMTGVKATQSAGRKKYEDTRKEGLHYFFSDPFADSYEKDISKLDLNPLWSDHRGDSLFVMQGASLDSDGVQKEGKTPDPVAGIFDFVVTFLNDIFSLFGDLLHLIGVKAKFDAMYTDGYFISEVHFKVRSIDDILPHQTLAQVSTPIQTDPLEFEAKAAVLTNNWNAGGRDHANQESRGLILTSLLSPISDTINTILYGIQKVIDLFPIRTLELPNMPAFGYVADDLMPYEHVKDTKMELKENEQHGLYYYKEK